MSSSERRSVRVPAVLARVERDVDGILVDRQAIEIVGMASVELELSLDHLGRVRRRDDLGDEKELVGVAVELTRRLE